MVLSYTADHEWILVNGNIATVGISNFAQEQLGEIVYVEPPELKKNLSKGETAAVVESVKAASEIFCPASGTVIEFNQLLIDTPSKLNLDPTGEGWIFRINLSDPIDFDGLMSDITYQEYIQGKD